MIGLSWIRCCLCVWVSFGTGKTWSRGLDSRRAVCVCGGRLDDNFIDWHSDAHQAWLHRPRDCSVTSSEIYRCGFSFSFHLSYTTSQQPPLPHFSPLTSGYLRHKLNSDSRTIPTLTKNSKSNLIKFILALICVCLCIETDQSNQLIARTSLRPSWLCIRERPL